MISVNIASCPAPVCYAGLHTSAMSAPAQLFVSCAVRAQSLERLTLFSQLRNREDSVTVTCRIIISFTVPVKLVGKNHLKVARLQKII